VEQESSRLKLSRYVVTSDALADKTNGTVRRALFGTRLGVTLLVSESTWRTLTTGQFQILPTEMLERLVSAEILVPAGEDELATVIQQNKAAIQSPTELYQVIQPTAWCQLGCGYCGQEHSVRFLSSTDQQLLIERIRLRLASGRYSRLRIGWFGAEPLVGLRVMRAMSPLLQGAAEAGGCTYVAKIVTNGVLLTETTAVELVERHKVESAEVTLDGLAEHHDGRRFTKAGKPTFAQIFENLCAVAALPNLPLRLIVRCNVDRFNVEGVSPLMRLLANRGLQRRISFYVAPIHSWGNDADELAMSPEEFGSREIEWLAELLNLGFEAVLLPTRKPVVCMAVQRDAELVDASGDVFNCTEVSQVPAYGSPNVYAIGRVGVGPRSESRLSMFNDEVLKGAYGCPTCPMLPVCGGGCPKQWHEGRVPCPSAKFNAPERLALLYAVSRGRADKWS